MLAIFLQEPKKTLIIVPSDALRHQTMLKMISLGIIPKLNYFDGEYLKPVVGIIKSEIKSIAECNRLFNSCNIIVATIAAMSVQKESVRLKIAELCKQLFVDEAHHIAARTWSEAESLFNGKPILQFTATPYREDKRRLTGKIIYAYPLRLAQLEGVFSKINYHSIFSETDSDKSIALAAVQQLESDLSDGYDHLMMVRVRSIVRSMELLQIYESFAASHSPVRLDSKMPAADQQAALSKVKKRESRIIICVDMLGEGFDLPSLKIAAVHDPHKSLSVTLQFIGRFARTGGESLGEATVFVPRAIYGIDTRLRKLYGEDSDWNKIISEVSEDEVSKQQERLKLETSFKQLPSEVPIQVLKPKLSTVVYAVDPDAWVPDRIYDLFDADSLLTKDIGISDEYSLAWFVTQEASNVRWGEFPEIQESSYNLYALHCDQAKGLLYINSTNNSELHESLATAVCGDTATLIKGNVVYRILNEINRGVPNNIGLLDSINQNRRFSMHVGADVVAGLDSTAAQKAKTNIYVNGYQKGVKVGFGASRKGRIWSHKVADDIYDWMKWVKPIGPILQDESISLESVIGGFIIPKFLTNRPKLVPLGIDWSSEISRSIVESTTILTNGVEIALLDIDMSLKTHDAVNPITFILSAADLNLEFAIEFSKNGQRFKGPTEPLVVYKSRTSSVLDFLNLHGVNIFFEQEALMDGSGYLLQPDRKRPIFGDDKIEVVDWSKTDIKLESQGPERNKKSIQYRAIDVMCEKVDWDIVLDDDGPYETADIVLLKRNKDKLNVTLVHCKYSAEIHPGARVKDFYEVCGQAEKCAKHKGLITNTLKNLLRRERERVEIHGHSGLVVGTQRNLFEMVEASPYLIVEINIVIVQPGLSKSKISKPIRELLGCVDLYLSETATSGLRVICSN
jgi:hypothetical protein